MFKLLKAFAIALFLLTVLHSSVFCQETLTVTTYYPSPFGSYRELTVSGSDSPLRVTCSGTRCIDVNKTGAIGEFIFQTFRIGGIEKWRINSSPAAVGFLPADHLSFYAVNTDNAVFVLGQNKEIGITIDSAVTVDPLNTGPTYFPITRYRNNNDVP
jgi:hypothetical protein